MAAIRWLPWGTRAFARAQSEGKPVLLSIGARWCCHTREMDRVTWADAEVAAVVARRFIPVRVDADRRPDLMARYGLEALPTTAFLTPDGEMIGGGTRVEPARLAAVLPDVAAAFSSGRLAGRCLARDGGPSDALPDPDRLLELVAASFDPVHGGFGGTPKFPHAAPVRLALEIYRQTGSTVWREMVVTSLDRMGWGRLCDAEAGGFYRCAYESDWSAPAPEKLLDVNAALLSLYIEAGETLQLARYAERADGVLRYLQTRLADVADGGWAGSERTAPVHDDHAREGMAAAEAGAIDRTLYVDWNAATISAALEAGRVLNAPGVSEFAIRSLERIVTLCYRPGAGMAHYADPAMPPAGAAAAGPRGLLDDQIATSLAHLDAFEATGNIVYQMMAEELALYAIRTMWDEELGAFLDRIPCEDDIGLLRERAAPFVGNCLAARMLCRLSADTGRPDYRLRAARIIGAMAGRAAGYGPLAAEYILTAKEVEQR